MHDFWVLDPQYRTFDDKIRATKCKPLLHLYYECSRNLNVDPSSCTMLQMDYQTCRKLYENIKDK